jgi:hypothetical protein
MKNRLLYREIVSLLVLERQEIYHDEWESIQKRIQEILVQIGDSENKVDKLFVDIIGDAGHVAKNKEAKDGKDS